MHQGGSFRNQHLASLCGRKRQPVQLLSQERRPLRISRSKNRVCSSINAPCTHLLARFPTAPSGVLSTGRDKNAVDYLPSPVLCVQGRWAAIGQDSKLSFTAWNCRICSLEKHRYSFHNCPNCTMEKARVVSYILFIFFLLIYQSHFRLNKCLWCRRLLAISKSPSFGEQGGIHFGHSFDMNILRQKMLRGKKQSQWCQGGIDEQVKIE